MIVERDPIIHLGITDCLPVNHPHAFESLNCVVCETMVHAFNNETMTPWAETAKGPYCFDCFLAVYNDVEHPERFDELGHFETFNDPHDPATQFVTDLLAERDRLVEQLEEAKQVLMIWEQIAGQDVPAETWARIRATR